MKLWIIGAQGMLGTCLQKLFEERNIDFVCTTSKEVDIRNKGQVERAIEAHKPSHIINCAAYTNVDLAESQPETARLINSIAPHHLGELAAKYQIGLIHYSTDYVFNGEKNTPYTETDPCSPLNVYGTSKWEGEKELLAAYPQACIIRSSSLFAWTGKNFVSTILRLIQERKQLEVVSDQLFSPTYCPDLAVATLNLLDSSGVYHFANAGVISWFDFANQIFENAKKAGLLLQTKSIQPTSSKDSDRAASRPPYSALSTEKYKIQTGSQPRAWEDTLEDFFQLRCTTTS